jgi:hypothetical protein
MRSTDLLVLFVIRKNGHSSGRRSFHAIAFQLCFRISHQEVQEKNQEAVELKGTHELMVYANDVNILGQNTNTITKTKKLC